MAEPMTMERTMGKGQGANVPCCVQVVRRNNTNQCLDVRMTRINPVH